MTDILLNSALRLAKRREEAILELKQVLDGDGLDNDKISTQVAKIVFDLLSQGTGAGLTKHPFTKEKYPDVYPPWCTDRPEVPALTHGNLRAEKQFLLDRLEFKQQVWKPKAQALRSIAAKS